jgi:hypothetical protein
MSIMLAAAMVIVTGIPTNDFDQVQGRFDARLDRNPYVNLNVSTEDNGFSNWGQSVDRADLRELRVMDGRVAFRLARAAGTFAMEGRGTEARARGTFGFIPSEIFRRQMTALGFDGLTNERMFIFAMGDLTIADVKYIEQQTSDDLTTNQLVRMVQHNVTEDFVKGMADAGFRNLRTGELINARDHGVTPTYVSNMQKLGYDLTLRGYIRAKDHGVSERHVAEMKELGLENLSLDQLITLINRRR